MNYSIADLLVRQNNNLTSNETINRQTQKTQNILNKMAYSLPDAMFRLHSNYQHQSPEPTSTIGKKQAISLSSQQTLTAIATEQSRPTNSLDTNISYSTSVSTTTVSNSGQSLATTTTTSLLDEATAMRDRDSGNSSAATSCSITSPMPCKNAMEQANLQRRPSNSSLGGTSDTILKSYPQMLLGRNSPLESSGCKDKYSLSSSTSSTSTPPPTSLMTAVSSSLASNNTISSNFSSASSHSLLKKSLSDTPSSVYVESIEEETRCVVCNAHFPNVWLLEQHAALQHPLLGPDDEKPFICEQCGQSYRYRSAYTKHKEQNHRARLPADKLFTCDVCGMQFRYLKSFKKHRLNHALERLHGKKCSPRGSGTPSPQVSTNIFANHFQQHLQENFDTPGSTNQALTKDSDESNRGEDLRIKIKKEANHSDDDDNENLNNYTKGAIINELQKPTLIATEADHMEHLNYKPILQGTHYGLSGTTTPVSMSFGGPATNQSSNKRV